MAQSSQVLEAPLIFKWSLEKNARILQGVLCEALWARPSVQWVGKLHSGPSVYLQMLVPHGKWLSICI